MKNLDKTRLCAIGCDGINVLVTALVVLIWVAAAPGQRGMGDDKGIAQQRLKPRLVLISGKLQEIKTHPCENTTGKADLGTHLILRDKQGRELNIHLGPAPELSETVKQLTVGRKLDLLGFRTDKMPPNQYVAQTLILGSRIIQLRDSDLRPYWSGSRLGQETLSPSTMTTADQKTVRRGSCLYYGPKLCQSRCFRDAPRPRWRRFCRGRAYCRRWEWDN
jgi:hypothetical protein